MITIPSMAQSGGRPAAQAISREIGRLAAQAISRESAVRELREALGVT